MRRLVAVLLSLSMFLPAPLWAAYVFDSTDHIDSANDAVTGINIDSFSWSCWVNITTAGASLPEQVITHAALIAGGNFRMSMEFVSSGGNTLLEFGEGFSGNAFSLWRAAQVFNTGTWYQIGVDYDSNSAGNPVMYVNGASSSVSVQSAPSGTRTTGADSLRIGADLGGTSVVQGSIAECGFWNRRLTSGEWSNLGVDKWAPSKISSGLVYYIPMISDASETQGATGTLTVTGAVIGTHPPGIVYPGGSCKGQLLLLRVGGC